MILLEYEGNGVKILTTIVLAAQDLSIDLQALAASLSNMPVWNVLDIDAALCKTYLPKTDTSLHRSASISKDSVPSHSPAEVTGEQPNTAAHFRSATPIQSRSRRDSSTGRSAESSSQLAASPIAETTTTSLASPAPDRAAEVQTQPVAHRQSQASVSLQTGGDDLAGKPDMDDLDALLNAPSLSTKAQKASTSVSKPAPENQDSLEDWLNSL